VIDLIPKRFKELKFGIQYEAPRLEAMSNIEG
jgi:hypothetical protein